jgi:hypothetical protein
MDQSVANQKERQTIRTHNLNARKLGGKVGANLSKKRIVGADGDNNKDNKNDSRRLSRAGFEGRKPGFLNGKSSPNKASSTPSTTTRDPPGSKMAVATYKHQ